MNQTTKIEDEKMRTSYVMAWGSLTGLDLSDLVKPYKCKVCEKKFKTEFGINNHVLKFHNEEILDAEPEFLFYND